MPRNSNYSLHNSLKDVSVVIPSYEEDLSILSSLKKELESVGAEVIIVDDGSECAYHKNAIKHGVNQGYGSALMTGIKNSSNETVILMDGDGQHTVRDAINLNAVNKMIRADMIIGARRIEKESFFRFWGRKALNFIASLVATHYLQDLNSGMRLVKRGVALSYFPILCKTFSFTTSLTMAMLCDNYRVEFFPINVQKRRHGKSRVKVIRDGVVTLKYILYLGLAIRTRGIRAWLRQQPWWLPWRKKYSQLT